MKYKHVSDKEKVDDNTNMPRKKKKTVNTNTNMPLKKKWTCFVTSRSKWERERGKKEKKRKKKEKRNQDPNNTAPSRQTSLPHTQHERKTLIHLPISTHTKLCLSATISYKKKLIDDSPYTQIHIHTRTHTQSINITITRTGTEDKI